ncbi:MULTISPECIES: glycosyltransferase [unclassified Pseudoalteromonas]|uniref:glycosyltransferase n=1 Tax=unclassified Pseudoalteromonas TaxID=194690 RepID=UPI0030141E54
MKLLFVLEDFTLGGVERVTLQLITGLVKTYDCTVEVAAQSLSGPLLDKFREVACVTNNASSHKSFRQLTRRIEPDLVIFTKGGLSRLKFSVANHCKTVVIQHVPIQLPEAGRIKNVIRRCVASILFRMVDKVICVSDGILDNLVALKVCSPEQALRIYNPVLSEEIQTLAQHQQHDYQNYYVCVGRLHFQKGYDLLIESIKLASLNGAKVVILGDGPNKRELEQAIADNALQGQIILHGPSDNPYKYMQGAKAILLPSRWEGLPTVLVEASFLGVPMVAFDCRYGPKELSQNGKYGHLIPQGDIKGFADAIDAVEQGKALAPPKTDEFTLKSAVANYHNLFLSLLSDSKLG